MNANVDENVVQETVLTAIRQTNLARTPDSQISEAPDAVLFGDGSPLDSLGLVSLLMEVEELLRDEGIDVTLSDERAMSQKSSPFRSISVLTHYICDVHKPLPS